LGIGVVEMEVVRRCVDGPGVEAKVEVVKFKIVCEGKSAGGVFGPPPRRLTDQ
jgi:hypothetical protein